MVKYTNLLIFNIIYKIYNKNVINNNVEEHSHKKHNVFIKNSTLF